MAKDKKDKKYDGKDAAGWVVRDVSGKPINRESHDGFASANQAAKRYTEMTGIFAAAVRA